MTLRTTGRSLVLAVFLGFLVLVGSGGRLAAQGVPCILGSPMEQAFARGIGLQGTYLTSIEAVPQGSRVVILGPHDAQNGIDDVEADALIELGCLTLRVAGRSAAETRQRIQALKAMIDGGGDPFANIPRTMSLLADGKGLGVLDLTPTGAADRRQTDPEFRPHPPPFPRDIVDPVVSALEARLAAEGRLTLTIVFAPQSSAIPADAETDLARIAALMKKLPALRFRVEGHTDSFQDPSYNQQLSEARAEAVKNWLMQHAIEAGRLNAVGMGERFPIADNSTEAGRARNRRVVLVRE